MGWDAPWMPYDETPIDTHCTMLLVFSKSNFLKNKEMRSLPDGLFGAKELWAFSVFLVFLASSLIERGVVNKYFFCYFFRKSFQTWNVTWMIIIGLFYRSD